MGLSPGDDPGGGDTLLARTGGARAVALAGRVVRAIALRFGQAFVRLFRAEPVPRLGVGRQGEAVGAEQSVGDELGGALPALVVALAPARVVLEPAGQHHAGERGLDQLRAGFQHPLRVVADDPPVARERLSGRVLDQREPQREARRRTAGRAAAP